MKMTKIVGGLAFAGVLILVDAGVMTAQMAGRATDAHLMKEVRHELVMLPYYGVFDNLAYQVDGNNVTLFGQVTRPTMKSEAENAVKHIEGVGQVINNIEVLPVSPMDDQTRRAVFRAVYGKGELADRYAFQAVPAIHIIVKNGNVTLIGVVNSAIDKQIAVTQANGVPGVFGVKDELVIQK